MTEKSVIQDVLASQKIPQEHRVHILRMLQAVEERQNVLSQVLLTETLTLAMQPTEDEKIED